MEGGHGGGPGGRAQDGDEAGHAEGDTDLARHGVEGGAGGEALRWQRRRGRAAERGQHEPDAEATEQAAREVGAEVVGRGAHVEHPPEAAGGEEERAERAHGAVADARPEQPAGEGGQPGQQRSGGDEEAGAQHRLVPDPGEEEDAAEDQRAEAAEEGERADVGQGHRPVPDDRGLEDRVGVAPRAGHQPGARDGGQREGAQDPRAVPAPVRPLRRWRRPRWPPRPRAGRRRAGRSGAPPGRAPRAARAPRRRGPAR